MCPLALQCLLKNHTEKICMKFYIGILLKINEHIAVLVKIEEK